jgi:signal transduction histidine kinase
VHVENILTIGMCGALVFLVIRMAISKVLEPDRSHFAWISIGLCGITFCVARVVHHSDPDQALALHMVRAQYASAILLPVLALMTIENLGEMPRSRATTMMWLISLPLSALFLITPWFVTGPPVFRSDLLGLTFYAGQPGPMLWIMVPLGIWMVIALRRRLAAIPPTFASLRRTLRVALVTAIVLGANDSLHGAGVFMSVPMFEYSFLVVAIVSTRVELRRTAIVREALHALVQERDREVESKRQAIDTALHKLTRSEARYRHLAQATREGVVVLQGQRVIDVNDAFLAMLDTTEASLLGADASELVEPSDRPLVEKLVAGEEIGPSDVRAYKGDQSLLAVSVKATGVPEGSPGTRVLLVRDISGERELRLQLLRADRLAAVGTLAAGTAHEINNPLVYVVGNAEVLAQELERLEPMVPKGELDLAKEVVGEISIGGDRVRRIVKDLMSLARDRSTDESAVDVRKVLESTLAMAANQFRHRATVVRELDDIPKVYASEVRLGQVFLNLLVNAAQAIPEGRLAENTVTVKTFAEADQVIIEIADTGSGMDAATRDRIFDPFFTTKEVGKGTGLGLSISHGIVSTLGGKIEVESAVGKGSRFRISLPAMAAKPDIATFVQSSEATPTRRILVVDDEELVARNLARMLSPHRVDVANSGREALDRCATDRYDVVLCDLMMPDVTGMEVYTQIVAADPAAASRFLFMTGGAFTDKARDFLDKVPTRCLEKPISKADLHRAIAEVPT